MPWYAAWSAGFPGAFLSWPQNSVIVGLADLLLRFPCVAYLGSNTSGNACGWPGLFRRLASRPVLEYVPERKNALIVYGNVSVKNRELVGEEWTAMTIMSQKDSIDFADLEPGKTYPVPEGFDRPGREW